MEDPSWSELCDGKSSTPCSVQKCNTAGFPTDLNAEQMKRAYDPPPLCACARGDQSKAPVARLNQAGAFFTLPSWRRAQAYGTYSILILASLMMA
jgi:hypothetical protein